jgi:hypothetical protein
VKLLGIILSVYFLALNLVPCSDTGNSKDDTQVISVIDFDGDHDQDCELCSPFCQCHCCHVHTIDFGMVDFKPIPDPISQENFSHIDSLSEEITFSLVQPPKV